MPARGEPSELPKSWIEGHDDQAGGFCERRQIAVSQ